ncbi:MAG: divalent metal cation transporter [Phycisphaerae bacterium]
MAAAIVPLATAYSIAEGIGAPASLNLDTRHFHVFYAVFIGLTVAAVSVVALPGIPLIPLMFASQVVNAVLLPLHVAALQMISGDHSVMGTFRSGTLSLFCGWFFVALVLICLGALAVSWIGTAG